MRSVFLPATDREAAVGLGYLNSKPLEYIERYIYIRTRFKVRREDYLGVLLAQRERKEQSRDKLRGHIALDLESAAFKPACELIRHGLGHKPNAVPSELTLVNVNGSLREPASAVKYGISTENGSNRHNKSQSRAALVAVDVRI